MNLKSINVTSPSLEDYNRCYKFHESEMYTVIMSQYPHLKIQQDFRVNDEYQQW